MVRMARLVIPGQPHHVTQRGVRRIDVFTRKRDSEYYIKLLKEACQKAQTEVLAYCLMPNHVHFIMIPSQEDGLRVALGETHRRYTRMVNAREECTGHLWQERFHSFPMDESHLYSCVRYVELNPVRAGLVDKAERWLWSSARAHLTGEDDQLVKAENLRNMTPDWKAYLDAGTSESELNEIYKNKRSGRPLGSVDWLRELEKSTGRRLIKHKPGPKI